MTRSHILDFDMCPERSVPQRGTQSDSLLQVPQCCSLVAQFKLHCSHLDIQKKQKRSTGGKTHIHTHRVWACVCVGGISGTQQPSPAVLSKGLHDCRDGGRGAWQTHYNAIIFDIFENNVSGLTQMSPWLGSYQLSIKQLSSKWSIFSSAVKTNDAINHTKVRASASSSVTLEKTVILRGKTFYLKHVLPQSTYSYHVWPVCHASIIFLRLFKHLLHSSKKPLQSCIIYALRW